MISGQEDTRARQKDRTRTAIVEAAVDLLREDVEPTVPRAAEAARVSRATAYRYFPTKESLLREVANVHPAIGIVDRVIDNLASENVEERLRLLLDTFNPVVLEDEAHMRASLQVFQDNWLAARREGETSPYVRSRRRMRWLDEVLAPLEGLSETERVRLRAALALTVGIDSIVIMKDVCELGDEQALDVLRWAASALLRAGLEEAGAQRRRAKAARGSSAKLRP